MTLKIRNGKLKAIDGMPTVPTHLASINILSSLKVCRSLFHHLPHNS